MKLNKTILVALAIAGGAFVSSAQTVTFRFQNAPLENALNMFAEYTGKTVEVAQEVDALISADVRNVTLAEAIAALERELNAQNIGLFSITTNRVVATWLDPSKAPTAARNSFVTSTENETPYAERRRMRLEEARKGAATNTPLSAEAMQKQLHLYQLDLMQQGKAPMPIPLTKEMDDQLAKEGILPPLVNSEKTETSDTNLDHISGSR